MSRVQMLLLFSCLALGCACALLSVAGGCQQGSTLSSPTAIVTGQVTLDDKPFTQGMVVFYPDKSKGTTGPIGVGAIDENGRYQIKTSGNDGALVGWHTVTVQAHADDEGMTSLIPDKYSLPDDSILKKEVKAGQDNVIDLELKSAP